MHPLDSVQRLRPLGLAASVAVFGLLATSAWAFARLPQVGFSLDDRRFSGALDVRTASVILDPNRGGAWLVGDRSACLIDLARGAAVDTKEFSGLREPLRHLAARGTVLVVRDDPEAPRGAVAFRFASLPLGGTAHPETLLHQGQTTNQFPESWALGSTMTNLSYDPTERSFDVGFTHTEEDARAIIFVPVEPRGGVGEPSIRPLMPTVGAVRAIFAKADPRVLLFDRTLHGGEKVEPLPIPEGACLGGAGISCVRIQGEPLAADDGTFALFVGADGKVTPASAIEGYEQGAALRLYEVMTPGLATPRIASTREGVLTVGLPEGGKVNLEVRSGGGERVLFARRDSGRAFRVARDASPIEAWSALPFQGGVLLLDGLTRRGVVLGEDLAPIDPQPDVRAAALALLQERYRSSDFTVKLYVLAFGLFLPLFGLALWDQIRRLRGQNPGFRAATALALWTIGSVAFALACKTEIFPP